MKNVIILGSGRSGTSMMAGCFSHSGYFMGDNFQETLQEVNPKGLYEDIAINDINEEILYPYIPKRIALKRLSILNFPGYVFFQHQPVKWQRWLACIPPKRDIKVRDKEIKRIKEIVKKEPFCFKDPRFSYTLPVWKPYLNNCVFICVFRQPEKTASSVLKNCEISPYLNDKRYGIKISWKRAIKIWYNIYQHILKNMKDHEQWIYIHFDQLFERDILEKLSNLVEANIDYSNPEKRYIKNYRKARLPKNVDQLYQKLCMLAQYND